MITYDTNPPAPGPRIAHRAQALWLLPVPLTNRPDSPSSNEVLCHANVFFLCYYTDIVIDGQEPTDRTKQSRLRSQFESFLFVSLWIGDGSESPAELECSSACTVHHGAGAGEGGNLGSGDGSGGDGARASEGRSFVLKGFARGLLLSRLASESPCSSTCKLRVLSSLPIPRDD